MVNIGPETVQGLILLLIGFIAGLTVPTYFAIERLSGFGRWVALKFPYEPPPGKEEEEAMEEASNES